MIFVDAKRGRNTEGKKYVHIHYVTFAFDISELEKEKNKQYTFTYTNVHLSSETNIEQKNINQKKKPHTHEKLKFGNYKEIFWCNTDFGKTVPKFIFYVYDCKVYSILFLDTFFSCGFYFESFRFGI